MPQFIPRRCIIPGPWNKLLGMGPVLNVSLKVPISVAQLTGGSTEIQTIALIDTGASITAISADLAAQLGLQAADKIPIQGAHSLELCKVYSVDFTFDGSNFWISNKWVCEMADPLVGRIGMLVGRDVLRNTYFTYDGFTGTCTIDIPSISHPEHPENPQNRPQIIRQPSSSGAARGFDKSKRKSKAALTKLSRKKNR